MSDDSSSSYRIEPLTGDNYHTWRTQMTDILAELELWEYVTGAIKQPSDTNLQAAWRKKDAKALRAIRLRVAKDALVYVQDAKTSKEAWDTLAETFQETGPIDTGRSLLTGIGLLNSDMRIAEEVGDQVHEGLLGNYSSSVDQKRNVYKLRVRTAQMRSEVAALLGVSLGLPLMAPQGESRAPLHQTPKRTLERRPTERPTRIEQPLCIPAAKPLALPLPALRVLPSPESPRQSRQGTRRSTMQPSSDDLVIVVTGANG
ncbi:hypothetical protein NUW54_g5503 [Trametes sanguinea]|uniref:Uncharacterized protein n=1 Tax=Trametes sanguinea TaxID=158606 RepID=A0ACC1PXM8_9APHY|nr:hypothetical protein NUW54_g5503 [Trametes sanguinea]